MSFHGVPASLDAGFRIRTTPPDRCPTSIATPPSGICAAALLPGHSSVAGTVLRPRYRGRLQHRLQIGPHHFLDPVDCREPGDQLQIRLFRSLAICSERIFARKFILGTKSTFVGGQFALRPADFAQKVSLAFGYRARQRRA